MSIRVSRVAIGVMAVAVVAAMCARVWAVYFELGPSKDDWGLKYGVEVSTADSDEVNVHFTLADEGRLKPIYSATVVAFSKPDSSGGRSYDAKALIELKATKDGKRAGQVRIRQDVADRAMIRILTQTFDGRPQTSGARYYDIPLRKFLDKASTDTPASKATR